MIPSPWSSRRDDEPLVTLVMDCLRAGVLGGCLLFWFLVGSVVWAMVVHGASFTSSALGARIAAAGLGEWLMHRIWTVLAVCFVLIAYSRIVILLAAIRHEVAALSDWHYRRDSEVAAPRISVQ